MVGPCRSRIMKPVPHHLNTTVAEDECELKMATPEAGRAPPRGTRFVESPPGRSGRTRTSFPLRAPLLASVVRQSIGPVSGNGFTSLRHPTELHHTTSSTRLPLSWACIHMWSTYGHALVVIILIKEICSRLSSKRKNSVFCCL